MSMESRTYNNLNKGDKCAQIKFYCRDRKILDNEREQAETGRQFNIRLKYVIEICEES
jgi:hypothetical protein